MIAKVWKGHFIVVAGIFMVLAAVLFFTDDMAATAPFKDLIAIQNALTNESMVNSASVSKNITTSPSNEVSSSINTQVLLDTKAIEDDELARRLAIIVIDNYPDSQAVDRVNVTLTYGYDIGISSKWQSYSTGFESSELQVID